MLNTHKLFNLGEFKQRSLGTLDKLARSIRSVSNDTQPSSDGRSFKLRASDNTLNNLSQGGGERGKLFSC